MNKVLLILFAVLLLLPLRLVSQEEYRVITKKELDTFYGKQRYDGRRKVYVTESNGKTTCIKTKNVLSIRKEVKEWNYFEWDKNAFTDYLEVNINSMSKEELFTKAKEWIKISFLPTEKGFLLQPDSIFTEYKGRGLYRSPFLPKDGTVIVSNDRLPPIIPNLEYKFNIDEDNYKITLVGCNKLLLTSLYTNFPDTFYTVDLTFYEGGYKIDPINFVFSYIEPKYESEDTHLFDIKTPIEVVIENTIDQISGNYDKAYIFEVSLSDITSDKDESGVLSLGLRCLFTRVEVLFNDLNRTLFNYIKGNKLDPNIYVYYPNVGCWSDFRTW